MIKTSGAWYTIQCAVDENTNPVISEILEKNNINKSTDEIEKFFKFQGVNNLAEFLNNHTSIADFIYDKIKNLNKE